MRLTVLTLVIAWLSATRCQTNSEQYNESLRIRSLPDGKVHSHFQFDLSGDWTEGKGKQVGQNAIAHNYKLLPPRLLSIIQHYSVSELHFTLSSGRFSSSWGAPPNSIGSASGIEIWAWLQLIEGETIVQENQRWEGFKGAIAGLFCAGLGEGRGRESRPDWGFVAEGNVDEADHRLYHLLLPSLSATCTESLTPFLSLLPCSTYAGLSSLLNSHKLFDGDYTLIGVHFTLKEKAQNDREALLRLEVGSVTDPVRAERLRGGPGKRDFSMNELYDRIITKSCPVAFTSRVELVIPVDSVNPFVIEPSQGQQIENNSIVWDTTKVDEPLNVVLKWETETKFQHPHPSSISNTAISTRRLLTGYGQERGSIGIEISNNFDREVQVIWIEIWPWWLQLYLSSLKGTQIDASSNSSQSMISDLSYTLPIPRTRPTTLQTLLTLPPNSRNRFMINFQASYLWYTEYPPDAHRGFEIPGAITILLSESSNLNKTISSKNLMKELGFDLIIHSVSSLLSLPTPDFSMPYNVIILTSTLIALFFGSLVNLLLRSWWIVDMEEREPIVGVVVEVEDSVENMKNKDSS